ncbi:hypothetical protein BDZ94DRAFT_1273319 [Collybia nuda]|uniref:MYND-type domain-containing protein n=1 Tax=Collybia nuda TaxID=64659 RepID=A0A9P6CDU4_9AGAR|nr:hypothetical protein BDZ94DRAFT_1273319 [Collybia nuda]
MSFQIITHTPEQATQWRQLAASNPSRVARTLALAPGQKTREGDNQGDVFPALAAVVEAARPVEGGRNEPWDRLVEAGVAEVLCYNVMNMTTTANFPPDTPAEILEEAKKAMPSSYAAALEALRAATFNFQTPPSRTDKRVIAALKKDWAGMMKRLWEQPENTLIPTDSHIAERVAVAQIVVRVIISDPSFLSIFYRPNDLTIQIMARHWKHSTAVIDTRTTAGVLHGFLGPTHPHHITYVQAHPPSYPDILSRIYLGVSPSPALSVPKQAKALVTTFAAHLPILSGSVAQMDLEFFTQVFRLANTIEPELVIATLKSTPFWNSAFRLMKKSAKSTEGLSEKEKEEDDRVRVSIMASVMGISADLLHLATIKNSQECEPLVRIWANENFFGALEESIEQLVAVRGITMQISTISSVINGLIQNAQPPFVRLLGTQFPRWRLIGTILKHDIKRQGIEGPPQISQSNDLPDPESNIWDHGAWQTLVSLQNACFDLGKTCAKRGCGNTGVSLCKCEAVLYCSDACRTKDSEGHNIVCGWMGVLGNVGKQNTGSVEYDATSITPPSVKTTSGPLEGLD